MTPADNRTEPPARPELKPEDSVLPFPGVVAWVRRTRINAWVWSLFWFSGLSGGISHLWNARGSSPWFVPELAGAVLFILICTCCFAFAVYQRPQWQRIALLVAALVLCLVYNGLLGSGWSPMFIYTSLGAAFTLPLRQALWTNGALVAAGLVIALTEGKGFSEYGVILLSSACSGLIGAYGAERRRIRERLRKGEEAMAQLAVNEERLRFARDLHDLLGHSLSLLSLKSQLAGRLVHADPEACARQIAEMEEISRRALAEVRDSVTGYRRPTLAVELARAHTALSTAGIEPVIDPAVTERARDLAPAREAALAWALRESVTNVVRHSSGARNCRVRLERSGGEFVLVVQDDGATSAESEQVNGNGLTGLGERLALEGGRLDAGPTGGGFRVRAYVPAASEEDEAAALAS